MEKREIRWRQANHLPLAITRLMPGVINYKGVHLPPSTVTLPADLLEPTQEGDTLHFDIETYRRAVSTPEDTATHLREESV